VDVVVAHLDAHRIGGDGHAFDDDVRVVGQDVAVLAGARFAFVAVAHQVLGTREGAWHEAPLQAGREPRAAAPAQRAELDLGDHLVGCHAFVAGHAVLGQDLAQRRIAATRHVVLQMPVAAIEPGVDLRPDVPAVEAGLAPAGLEPG
jgi:hypothetical protein